jgi:hypothetical protein
MINQEPVNEMIKALNDVERDIRSLTDRVLSFEACDKISSTNRKYLKMAIKERLQIIAMLEIEYTEGISMDEIFQELQRT